MQRYPLANWAIMGITIVVSIAMFGPLWQWQEQSGIANLFGLGDPPEGMLDWLMFQPKHFHVTQLVGSTLVHAGILHLAGNMLFLWVFGNAVNAKLGQWQYVLLYVMAAIFEGLVNLAVGPNIPSIGASGAIMGMVGAYLILFPTNDVSIFYWFGFLWTGLYEISGLWIILMYIAFDVWGVFSHESGIGYLAHVAGFVFGAGAVALALKMGWVQMTRLERSLLQVMRMMPEAREEDLSDAGARMPVTVTRAAVARRGATQERLPPIDLD